MKVTWRNDKPLPTGYGHVTFKPSPAPSLTIRIDSVIKVLFVCTGNICRSPTADGVFRKMVREAGLDDHISVDSCGLSAYHVGELPDPRSREMAKSRGIDLSDIRSRKIRPTDYHEFDYVLAMDDGHPIPISTALSCFSIIIPRWPDKVSLIPITAVPTGLSMCLT